MYCRTRVEQIGGIFYLGRIRIRIQIRIRAKLARMRHTGGTQYVPSFPMLSLGVSGTCLQNSLR
jgi:hypothetical protein